ncbi:hypothetical protein [Paludisphaera mucosa]|uniref:Uncharacterized protein n=1 Tax=Paludisphaera mucosa TaxID=3030827 RepID=A0ABT6FHA9_9BACT|nr:hypothetical protein [Paludisphaera mucosa]MDG3006976.1 hypothetical protein [Paludisphaera mucosa]
MRRWFLFAPGILSLALAGCGGEEEPTEVPKAPPRGQGLPKLARLEPVPSHPQD